MEAAVLTYHFDINLASYAGVTQGITNGILMSKNMSNEINTLQIKLNVTWWVATEANPMLDWVLVRGGDRKEVDIDARARYYLRGRNLKC